VSDQRTDGGAPGGSEYTGDQAAIVAALTDISERSQALIREEIELAKAELTEKASKLAKGTAVGSAAGIFVAVGLLFVLTGCAWLAWYALFPDNQFFWGFFTVAGVLFLLGALAGFLAARAFRQGSPPRPDMAIDEAKLIRETVTSQYPEATIPSHPTESR
jgi:uncharacterized membrane protein YqjE